MFLFEKKSFRIVAAGADPDALELLENRSGAFRTFRIINRGDGPCRIREAVVLSLPHTFPADTRIYGEGFNMLSQYWGTLEEIEATPYTDRDHYRLPVREGFFTCYNLLHLFPSTGSPALGGFASCRRFASNSSSTAREPKFPRTAPLSWKSFIFPGRADARNSFRSLPRVLPRIIRRCRIPNLSPAGVRGTATDRRSRRPISSAAPD